MGKLRTLPPRVADLDLRRAKPPPKRADAELLTPEHQAWRQAVCERAGWQCQWMEHGARCQRSRARGDRMVADHVIERADGGALFDPNNGMCLCVEHNTRKGVLARQARVAR